MHCLMITLYSKLDQILESKLPTEARAIALENSISLYLTRHAFSTSWDEWLGGESPEIPGTVAVVEVSLALSDRDESFPL